MCRHYKIDPERGYLGKYITEVLDNIRQDIAGTLRWENVPDDDRDDLGSVERATTRQNGCSSASHGKLTGSKIISM